MVNSQTPHQPHYKKDKMQHSNSNFGYDMELRHTLAPVLWFPIAACIVMVAPIAGSLRVGDWSWVIGYVPACAAISGVMAWFQLSYKIWFDEKQVFQRAVGGVITSIQFNQITRVASEVSDVDTLVRLRRPFRRISIYGSTSEGNKCIDVSLKHFRPEDIRKLMAVIHERRPDLTLPARWS
jgi:hypothetical protein